MRHREVEDSSNLTIVEAVETLSSIADLDPDRDMAVSQRHELTVQGQPFTYRSVHWLQDSDADTTLNVVKETFKVVLRYLRSFYKEEHGYLTDVQTIEGIKTIMVLVGEAAKKLDRFTKLFHGAKAASVLNLKEYKQLQEFYQKRIARKIDEGTLGKWVLALTAPRVDQPVEVLDSTPAGVDITKRVIVDLDTVKKDSEYELFFMRKEDGTRYFSPSLLRNIRLVCDFGNYFTESKGDDPLARLDIWQDWICQITAKSMVRTVRKEADAFYRYYANDKDQELVCLVNYALMSLLLAANPRNLRRNRPVKSCRQYFIDFQTFLREALGSRDYQKLAAYPPKKTNKQAWCLLNTLHELCEGLYVHGVGYSEMPAVVSSLVEKARRDSGVADFEASSGHWWDALTSDYNAMLKLLRRHPNGPLYRVLGMLKEDGHQFFDPIYQDNIPNRWYDLQVGDQVIKNVRMPAPIRQDFVNKAVVNDEFKGMLRSYHETAHQGCHLVFNLEDRTAWMEHSRCTAVERLQEKGDFEKHLRVVTFATNTDFYNQMAPYNDANHSEPFVEQLLDQISGEGSGYHFPNDIKQVLLPTFVPEIIKGIHQMFFGGRNILMRRERLDFIQLTHLFMIFKIIESAKPESFSFMCKDGVDTGSAYSATLFAALRLFNAEELSQRDLDYLNLMLYGPPLFIRERAMLPERFQRAVGIIKAVALAREEHGLESFRNSLDQQFGKLFKQPILHAVLAIPEPIQVLY